MIGCFGCITRLLQCKTEGNEKLVCDSTEILLPEAEISLLTVNFNSAVDFLTSIEKKVLAAPVLKRKI